MVIDLAFANVFVDDDVVVVVCGVGDEDTVPITQITINQRAVARHRLTARTSTATVAHHRQSMTVAMIRQFVTIVYAIATGAHPRIARVR